MPVCRFRYSRKEKPRRLPGPISNPGIESILAAINPNSTSYYYYVLGDDNRHHFFNTYREMQNFMSTQAMYSHS